MTKTPKQPKSDVIDVPIVEEAVLADMSGPVHLSQEALWDNVGRTRNSTLGAWALSEAGRVERAGMAPNDAFLCGVGYAITAIARQLRRNNAGELQTLEALYMASNAAVPKSTS